MVAAHKGHGKVDIPLPLLNGHHRVAQAEGDLLVEVELSEAELTGRGFRRPPPPPEDRNGNGSGSGDGDRGDEG